MNKSLEKAITEASRLPDDEQETVAALILEEIASERGWQQRFDASSEKLAELARTARQRASMGDVKPIDPSDLARE